MNYLTFKLFSNQEIKKILSELDDHSSWEDGKKTAGKLASSVKNNLQLSRESNLSQRLSQYVMRKMLENPLIKSFAIPKLIHGMMFTKAQEGMKYGSHIDNPYMSSGRSDLSFTLFISDSDDYEGGELNIQKLNSSEKIKLKAGEMIIYPSTSLHSVEEIKSGLRIVCVGWIESYLKSNELREYMFCLDAGAKGLLSEHGRSEQLDLIFQAYGNLLRALGD